MNIEMKKKNVDVGLGGLVVPIAEIRSRNEWNGEKKGRMIIVIMCFV